MTEHSLSRRRRGLAARLILAAGLAAAPACGLAPAPVVSLRVPERASFPPVGDALAPSCGTLDCHGQPARNLRLYGGRGLRLDPGANPADDPTTPAEHDASYRSIVGLDPEALDAAIAGGAADELTLIGKARGTQKHKGGTQMLRNDPLDRCLLSWILGGADTAACQAVSRAPHPQPETP